MTTPPPSLAELRTAAHDALAVVASEDLPKIHQAIAAYIAALEAPAPPPGADHTEALMLELAHDENDRHAHLAALAVGASEEALEEAIATLEGAVAEEVHARTAKPGSGLTGPDLILLDWTKAHLYEAGHGDLRPTTQLAIGLRSLALVVETVVRRFKDGTAKESDFDALHAYTYGVLGWPNERAQLREDAEQAYREAAALGEEIATFQSNDDPVAPAPLSLLDALKESTSTIEGAMAATAFAASRMPELTAGQEGRTDEA